jgi:hypothetical protein
MLGFINSRHSHGGCITNYMTGFSGLSGLTGKGFFNNLQGASSPTTPIIVIKTYSFTQDRLKIV